LLEKKEKYCKEIRTKMSLSFGPFFTCFLITIFLSGYLYLLLHRNTIFSEGITKFSIIGILIILIRMGIPVNFPFTYSIYSYNFLPGLTDFTTTPIGNSHFIITDLILAIWFLVSITLLIKLAIQHIRMQKYLSYFYIESNSKWYYLYSFIQSHYNKNVRISIIKKPISPSIFGLFTPTLILPDLEGFTKQEIECICMHELAHYKQHHLWMTLLMEIICRIHWWNPFIYYLKGEYALFLELSNDFFVIRSSPKFNVTDYADLIVRIAEKMQLEKQPSPCTLMSFAIKRPSLLSMRINYILNSKNKGRHYKTLNYTLCYSLICCAVFFSIFFTPEASFRKMENAEEPGVIQINKENTYILQDKNKYFIYINEEYSTTINSIPEELQDIPVYKKGESHYEK